MLNNNVVVKYVLLLVAIWMVLTNFVSWKNTFLENSDISHSLIFNLINNEFGQIISNTNQIQFGLKKEDIIHGLTIKEGDGSLAIVLNKTHVLSHIDSLSQLSTGLTVKGWGFVPVENEMAQFIIVVLDGNIVKVDKIDGLRLDVVSSIGDKRARFSGFTFSSSFINKSNWCNLKMYVLTGSLHLYPLPYQCTK